MTTGLVYGVESYSISTLKAQLLDVSSMTIGSGTTGQVLEITSENIAVTGSTGRVLEVVSINTDTATAALAAPSTANAGDIVTLDASTSVGTITAIEQVAGSPTVLLTGGGTFRQFVAPAINSTTATPLTFRVTVTGGGTADVTVNVYPHTMWICGPDPSRVLLPLFKRGRRAQDAAPVGPWPGWGEQTFIADFTSPVLVGGFVPDATGYLTSLQGGSAGYLPYSTVFRTTADAQQSLAVTYDGYLDIWLRQISGVPVIPQVLPLMANQIYGRYAVRFRSLAAAEGWTTAIGLTPADAVPQNGQINFPAGTLNADVLSSFTPATSGSTPTNVTTGQQWTSWHTAVIEWNINSVKCYLDEILVFSATVNVPATPMIFSIRPAGNSTTDAHVQIDWIAAWAAGGEPVPAAPEYIPSPATYPSDGLYPGGEDAPVAEAIPSTVTLPSDSLFPFGGASSSADLYTDSYEDTY
jgi:hypothetical protein